MKWRLSGQSQAILIPFMVDGQYVTPDSASIKLTVRDNSGSTFPGYLELLQGDVQSTQITLNLSTELNTLASDSLFETRYINVDFAVNGVPHTVKDSYRLHRFIPHSVSDQMVRSLIAADPGELPDSDIDVVAAYFGLANDYGVRVTQALTRTDAACLAANDAIALRAAIDICPSLPSRLLLSEKADNAAFQRATIDFEKLESDLRGKLADKLNQITTIIAGNPTSTQSFTIFTVTKPTDPITNT